MALPGSPKQDRNGVRSAPDLERKYDFSSLVGIKRAIKINDEGLTKTNKILEEFIDATLGELGELQKQVDGKIETWFYEGEPTLDNMPACEWPESTYVEHQGDLYYDKLTGYAYRFLLEDGKYVWMKLSDSDVTEALAIANAAQDTADGKRRVFTSVPVPPYDNGDLWFNNKEIYICQISKGEGEIYEPKDFITATKYTDDTVANKVGDELTVVRGTVLVIQESMDTYKVEITTTVKGIGSELEVAKTSILANTNEIDLRVRKDGVIGAINLTEETAKIQASKIELEGAVTITALAPSLKNTITGHSAQLNVHSEEIALRVTKDGVIGAINLTEETAKIQASKIELEGAVTITALAPSLKNTIVSYETQLNVLNNQIEAKIWCTDIDNATDDLTIGSRNLIRTQYIIVHKGEVDTSTYLKDGTVKQTSSGIHDGFRFDSKVCYQPHTEYTLSGYLSLISGVIENFYVFNGKRHIFKSFSIDGIRQTTPLDEIVTSFDANDGKRHYFELHFITDGEILDDVSTYYTYIQINKLSTTAVQYAISGLKLEKGNKATDWTPAPEDVDNEIVKVSNQYVNLLMDINGFKSTVAAEYTTKADLKDLEIGGRNLLRCTRKMTGSTEHIYLTPTVGLEDEEGYGVATLPAEGAYAILNFFLTETIEEVSGKKVTLSFDAKSDFLTTASKAWMIYVGLFDESNKRGKYVAIAYLDYEADYGGFNCSDYVNSEWCRCKITFKLPYEAEMSGTANEHIKYAVQIFINRTNTTAPISIRKVKCEYGDMATDWTPAPEDAEDEIVSIGTTAIQTLEKFNWIVKSGTSATDFTLTDKMASLTAEIVSLNANVKISGDMIVSGAITADKMNITDLSAIGATIGGWVIKNNSLQAGNIELLSSGFIQGGTTYHWSIDTAGMATFNKLIANGADITGKIQATSGEITGSLEFGKNGVITHTNGDCTVTIRSVRDNKSYGVIYITDTSSGNPEFPFRLNGDGSFSATKASIIGGNIGGWKIDKDKLTAGNIMLASSGKIDSTSKYNWSIDEEGTATFNNLIANGGTVGGFVINDNSIKSGEFGLDESVMICTGSNTSKSIGGSAEIPGWCITAGTNFGVTKNGNVYATDVKVSGEVHLKKGSSLGGWKTDVNSIYTGTWKNTPTDLVFMCSGSVGTVNLAGLTKSWVFGAAPNFGVTKNGEMYCRSGRIGDLVINTDGSLGKLNSGEGGTYGMMLTPGGYLGTDGRRYYIVMYEKSKPVGGLALDGWHTL